MDNDPTCSDIGPENYTDVWLGSNRTEVVSLSDNPSVSSGLVHVNSCTALSGSPTGNMTFANLNITGSVNYGFPSGGDFAPAWMIASYPSQSY